MKFKNVYFINGTAYAGKSTMVKILAEKYNGIACEENYHDKLLKDLDSKEFPGLTYTRDLQNWSDFIRRTPDEPDKAMDNFRECLKRINSKEKYNEFLNSGFNVILRDERRTVEETFLLVEESLKLK